MTINLSVPVTHELKPRLTVVGVGGAGCNAVNNMITAHLEGVDFVVANTDAQALSSSLTERRIQLGSTSTQGLGAGMRPDVGRQAAEEVTDTIYDHLDGANMLFITAGMGGGTGTGAAPVIARMAREQGILTVGVVTKPFQFEGAKRMRVAEAGIAELQDCVDTLIMIPNQNLFRIANENTTFADAFKMADDVLYSGVRGVTDLMVMPGLINLDFADVRSVMNEMGKAMIGTGEAEGERRALDAAEGAVNNPLLDDVSLMGARGVLINITGGPDMTLYEVDEACNHIREQVDDDANIIFGSTFDDELAGHVRVSVVATGIGAEERTAIGPNITSGVTQPISTVPGSLGRTSDTVSKVSQQQPSLASVSAKRSRIETQVEQPERLFGSEEPTAVFPPHTQTSRDETLSVPEDLSRESRATASFIPPQPSNFDPGVHPAAHVSVTDEERVDLLTGVVRGSDNQMEGVSERTGLLRRMAQSALKRDPAKRSRPTTETDSQYSGKEPVLETVEVGPALIAESEQNRDEDLLEIPAFLRRQAR